MIVGLMLMILIFLSMFSLILGNSLLSGSAIIGVDNSAIINGSVTTYVVAPESVLFTIDTTTLIVAGIALLVTIGITAGITGIQVLGSGLNAQSVRMIILLVAYGGVWTTLSILAFNLINSIEIFGSVLYITMTVLYAIGVIQKLSGSGD